MNCSYKSSCNLNISIRTDGNVDSSRLKSGGSITRSNRKHRRELKAIGRLFNKTVMASNAEPIARYWDRYSQHGNHTHPINKSNLPYWDSEHTLFTTVTDAYWVCNWKMFWRSDHLFTFSIEQEAKVCVSFRTGRRYPAVWSLRLLCRFHCDERCFAPSPSGTWPRPRPPRSSPTAPAPPRLRRRAPAKTGQGGRGGRTCWTWRWPLEDNESLISS